MLLLLYDALIAILEEYSITKFRDENYKLFKIKEGSDDISDPIPGGNNAILKSLKLAIANK